MGTRAATVPVDEPMASEMKQDATKSHVLGAGGECSRHDENPEHQQEVVVACPLGEHFQAVG